MSTLKTFDQYEREAGKTDKGGQLLYAGCAFGGEAGEVLNEIKKYHRDDKSSLTPERAEKIGQELGDCLWYMRQIANRIGYTLSEVATMNIEKLVARHGKKVG